MAHAISKGYLLLEGDDPLVGDLNVQRTKLKRRANSFLFHTLHTLGVAISMIIAFYLGRCLRLNSHQLGDGTKDLELDICKLWLHYNA